MLPFVDSLKRENMAEHSEKHNELRWYQQIAFVLLWGICRFFGFAPRWVRYYLLRPFVIAVLRLLRYRRKVIIENLTNSFPEKSKDEILAIMRKYYASLGEIIANIICLASADPKRDADVITWEDAPGHIAENKGRDWIAMASHYGCWEYYPLWSWVDHDGRFLCVYHPLKSPVFEKLFRRMRQYTPNVELVPMANTLRQYLRIRSSEYSTALGLISDQSPQLTADSQWYDFLNQKTTFISGGERLALRFGLPVYFCDVIRRSVGCYHVSFIPIYDGVESVEEGEITRRYVELLEKMIRRSPELWMWSHKRWKYTPEKQALMFDKSTLK